MSITAVNNFTAGRADMAENQLGERAKVDASKTQKTVEQRIYKGNVETSSETKSNSDEAVRITLSEKSKEMGRMFPTPQ
ncbi:MAG: hypothetical protein HQL54_12990 [Magnetococcales bacterium]|nr:hypothetical protein [Magnetococcales bacterium]